MNGAANIFPADKLVEFIFRFGFSRCGRRRKSGDGFSLCGQLCAEYQNGDSDEVYFPHKFQG
jgi:hypothetical protein